MGSEMCIRDRYSFCPAGLYPQLTPLDIFTPVLLVVLPVLESSLPVSCNTVTVESPAISLTLFLISSNLNDVPLIAKYGGAVSPATIVFVPSVLAPF